MKICITSTGADLKSTVDPRFGRAVNLLLVETETDEVRCLENATGSSHGAGVQAAQAVVKSGASAVVTGRIGPRAHEVLAAAGIQIYLTPPTTVASAIADFTGGRLEKTTEPTNEAHGGMRG